MLDGGSDIRGPIVVGNNHIAFFIDATEPELLVTAAVEGLLPNLDGFEDGGLTESNGTANVVPVAVYATTAGSTLGLVVAPLILDLGGVGGVGVSLEGEVDEAEAGDRVCVERSRGGTVRIALVRIQVVQDDGILIQFEHKQFLTTFLEVDILVIHQVTLAIELDVGIARLRSKELARSTRGAVRVSTVDGKLAHTGGTGHQLVVNEHRVYGVGGVNGDGLHISNLEHSHIVCSYLRSKGKTMLLAAQERAGGYSRKQNIFNVFHTH